MVSVGIQPTSDALKKELDQLTAAVGWSLSQWASVEDAIGHIFAWLVVGDANQCPAKAAIDSVINFNVKVTMTNAAAKWSLKDGEPAEWQTLCNRLRRVAKSRNELAHFTVVEASPPYPDGRTYSLSPHLGDLDALPAPGEEMPAYSTKEIRGKGEAFKMLAADLGRFTLLIQTARVRRPPASG